MCLRNLTSGFVIQSKCANESIQHWDYDEFKLQIKNGDLCLTVRRFKIKMITCHSKSLSQKWILENYDSARNPLGFF